MNQQVKGPTKAEKRARRSDALHQGRVRRSRDPIDSVARLFDHWRALARSSPPGGIRDEIAAVRLFLTDRISHLKGDRP